MLIKRILLVSVLVSGLSDNIFTMDCLGLPEFAAVMVSDQDREKNLIQAYFQSLHEGLTYEEALDLATSSHLDSLKKLERVCCFKKDERIEFWKNELEHIVIEIRKLRKKMAGESVVCSEIEGNDDSDIAIDKDIGSDFDHDKTLNEILENIRDKITDICSELALKANESSVHERRQRRGAIISEMDGGLGPWKPFPQNKI